MNIPLTAIIQARMTSQRLPGKVLLPLGGKTVLDWVVDAAEASGAFESVVVATSVDPTDDAIALHCQGRSIVVVRGPLNDVLARYLDAAKATGASHLVRLTADCPLLDPEIIAFVADTYRAGAPKVKLVSNASQRCLPLGLDCEAVSTEALRSVALVASPAEREHVTLGVINRPNDYLSVSLVFHPDKSALRVTLDTEADYALIKRVVEDLGDDASNHEKLVRYLESRPDVTKLNAHIKQKVQ